MIRFDQRRRSWSTSKLPCRIEFGSPSLAWRSIRRSPDRGGRGLVPALVADSGEAVGRIGVRGAGNLRTAATRVRGDCLSRVAYTEIRHDETAATAVLC